MKRVADTQAGAGLVEVLVAVAIIAVALVIFVAALSTGAFAVRTSNRLTTATNLAASQLESIKADSYADVVAGNYSHVAAPSGYTVAVITNTLNTGLLQVTVTVSYEGGELAVSNYKVNR
ncbi:MAG: hypothetical protein U9R05_09940 [Chloroflexota bacterium]|nr:hypothetical protein [Chloroflexota bacterium]